MTAPRTVYQAAHRCRTIADLARLAIATDADDADTGAILAAIHELAVAAHDHLDAHLRLTTDEPGIGYLDPVRQDMDERLNLAPIKPPRRP